MCRALYNVMARGKRGVAIDRGDDDRRFFSIPWP
jgi:hypothetical protein